MSVTIRTVCDGEVDAFLAAMSVPFHNDVDEHMGDRLGRFLDESRRLAAFENGEIVATFAAFCLDISVPGNVVACAGTTVVSTLPTHRRQGLLRAMMRRHFDELKRGSEPLAALWASEATIYGRFGYGQAAQRVSARIKQADARFSEKVDIGGTMSLLGKEDAIEAFAKIHDRIIGSRPGSYARTLDWWRYRVLADADSRREGATAHRRVVHRNHDTDQGYVIYRSKATNDSVTVQVSELLAETSAAEKALWQFLFEIDLVTDIEYWNLPIDSPLPWWLEQPRALEQKVDDSLWLRIVDVESALMNRSYATPGTLSIRVEDEFCHWNCATFELIVSADGQAVCRRIESSDADIVISVNVLASIYLGGYRPTVLASAGTIQGDPASVRLAERMFAWSPRPWCHEVF